MPSEIDVERACRLCLAEKNELLGVQDYLEIDICPESRVLIADILMECISINVHVSF